MDAIYTQFSKPFFSAVDSENNILSMSNCDSIWYFRTTKTPSVYILVSKYDGITICKVAKKEEEVQEQQKQHHEQDHDMKQSTLSDFL